MFDASLHQNREKKSTLYLTGKMVVIKIGIKISCPLNFWLFIRPPIEISKM